MAASNFNTAQEGGPNSDDGSDPNRDLGSKPGGRHEAVEASSQPGAWATFEAALRRVAEAGSGAAGPGSATGRAPATVLLTGESGSGKSRAARRIHEGSPRAGGPFVSVHLAGLASSLLEAELFGHAAGAFTGAVGERPGRFQRASGGTIVLEAIETLEFSLQVKLLRVLQERVVEPVGSESFVPVDARVIATSARDLRAAVEAGDFREDLYFRLAVVPLTVPPLRQRAHGVEFAALCEASIQDVARRIGARPRPLDDGALEGLAAHPWPGNFRELENAFERVLVLGAQTGPISEEEFSFLGESVRGRAHEIAAEAFAAGVGIEELDRAIIEEALRQERGNVSAAARRIGLSRRAFDYRRKRLES